MRPGKLPEPSLKRAVIGSLKEGAGYREKNIGVGCDAGFAISGEKQKSLCVSDAVLQGDSPVDLVFAFHRGANSMLAAGAVPRWVTVTLLLPEDWQEQALRGLMSGIDQLCALRKIEILGGQTETLPGMGKLVANFHFTGTKYREDFPRQTEVGKVQPGDVIVMSGSPAADLAGKWLVEEREILEKRFSRAFLAQAGEKIFGEAGAGEKIWEGEAQSWEGEAHSWGGKALYWDGKTLSIEKAACLAMDHGVRSMHDIGEGGIFGALRELGEREGCGLTVDLKKIPIQQEVIELCEVFDRNPYLTKSCGALFMVTSDPEGLAGALAGAGIPAAEIGHFTDDRKMTVYNRGETRYLDHPQMDECWR